MDGCPRLATARREVLLNEIPTPEMTWSVRDLLDFSYTPGLNEAFEGDWTAGDAPPTAGNLSDASFGLGGDGGSGSDGESEPD